MSSEPVSTFSFRAEFESGRSLEFVPKYVHPLGIGEINLIASQATSALELKFDTIDAVVDGSIEPGHATVTGKFTFHEPATVYALVPGGWLPLPFVIPSRFIVDRNVVALLKRLRMGQTGSIIQALKWWTKFFDEGAGMFNPLPYAFEAGLQRKPTYSEFKAAYDEGASEIIDALPSCHIIKYQEVNYRDAYAQLEAFDARSAREILFLKKVCPMVVNRVGRQKDMKLAKEISRIADNLNVYRASFVSIAALSCLFENIHGTPISIGREILKPNLLYSDSDAYNALSDLRHIELAAAGNAYFGKEAFSLCTCDRALAKLWCSLALTGASPVGQDIEFTFQLTNGLFNRLSEPEIIQLKAILRV